MGKPLFARSFEDDTRGVVTIGGKPCAYVRTTLTGVNGVGIFNGRCNLIGIVVNKPATGEFITRDSTANSGTVVLQPTLAAGNPFTLMMPAPLTMINGIYHHVASGTVDVTYVYEVL
jgi:hypothetical protein